MLLRDSRGIGIVEEKVKILETPNYGYSELARAGLVDSRTILRIVGSPVPPSGRR
jgi:hypothetical protein